MKVLAAGTFDLFHPGHEFYLREAAKRGELYVVVARDATVEKIKMFKPTQNEEERLKKIRSLPYVKKALLGDSGGGYDIVKRIKPDIVVMGHDQEPSDSVMKKELGRLGLAAKVVRIEAYMRDKYSSSVERKRINKDENGDI